MAGTGYATGLQVPRGSVGTPQLKNAAVTTPKIANNAVTSAKVRNGSLLAADFRSGQLPAGPAGPAGPPGLSAVERVEFTTPNNSTAVKTGQMACPEGKRLIGGGARLNGGGAAVAIQTSYPDNDNIYRAQGREVVATAANWSLTIFAICAVTS
ncbi:MAG: hypothetical protein R6W48_09700 [Gaiellaceae bacterium]